MARLAIGGWFKLLKCYYYNMEPDGRVRDIIMSRYEELLRGSEYTWRVWERYVNQGRISEDGYFNLDEFFESAFDALMEHRLSLRYTHPDVEYTKLREFAGVASECNKWYVITEAMGSRNNPGFGREVDRMAGNAVARRLKLTRIAVDIVENGDMLQQDVDAIDREVYAVSRDFHLDYIRVYRLVSGDIQSREDDYLNWRNRRDAGKLKGYEESEYDHLD